MKDDIYLAKQWGLKAKNDILNAENIPVEWMQLNAPELF